VERTAAMKSLGEKLSEDKKTQFNAPCATFVFVTMRKRPMAASGQNVLKSAFLRYPSVMSVLSDVN
jgi:hypothetical protein